MLKLFKIISVAVVAICLFSMPVIAGNKISTKVKIIHASTGKHQIDPGLSSIISELKSVFRYTSYRLIKQQNLNQGFSKPGSINLPGKRTMIITPISVHGQRIKYQINILKNRRSVFQTRIDLKNNSSLTIGGPKFKNGVLLFNIHGSSN